MKRVALLILVLSLAGCASMYPEDFTNKDPVVDMKGKNPEQYRVDLTECRAIIDSTIATDENLKKNLKEVEGEGWFAITPTGTFRYKMVKRCLAGRGYSVL